MPAPALSFAEAEAAAADYRRAARADNTRRAYRAAVARFTDWCYEHRQTALPAAPETVAAFLAAEAGRGLAVNTLRLRHAALRYLHLLAGYPPPTASPLVSATFAGIRRAHRRPLRKKTALVLEPLRAAIKTIPDTLPRLRDRALILVGFAAALRPSELARLDIASLTRHEDGITLFLPWRKNDQDAHGTTVWLPAGRTDKGDRIGINRIGTNQVAVGFRFPSRPLGQARRWQIASLKSLEEYVELDELRQHHPLKDIL